MPVDFTANPDDDPTTTESEGPMFAPIPTWERNRKRRGFGARSSVKPAAEPRTFVEDRDDRVEAAALGAGTGMAAGGLAADTRDDLAATDAPFASAPIYGDRRTTTRRGSAAPMAIVAGLIVLGGVAAAGWYASRPHDTGVAQLTPGAVSGTTTDTSAAPPTDSTLAQNAAPVPSAADTQAAAPRHAAAAPVRTRTTTVARARAPSRSAAAAGVNASATLPAAPAPYSSSAQTARPAPVTPAPTQAAPAPSATPAPTPGPADTAPTPPTATSPTPPPTETPPQ